MNIIKELNGIAPRFGNDCFFAENSVVIGDVAMGDNCSVWYNAVIRGDVHSIRIGNKVNIQDGAVIHCTNPDCPTTLGNNVSVGHRAIVHGCTIHDNVLVGMGAIVMDKCVIESNAVVAAGAVLTKGTRVESGTIYAGIPACKIKDIDALEFSKEIERIAACYIEYSGWHSRELLSG